MGSMLPYIAAPWIRHGQWLCHVVCVCVNNCGTTQPAELGYHIWLVVWNFFFNVGNNDIWDNPSHWLLHHQLSWDITCSAP